MLLTRDAATIDRYELKYLIPMSYVEPISDFIAPYCELDKYSLSTDNHFYTVNSLYLDTRGNEFLKQRLWGKASRFNMRARAYGDATSPPYFLEVKRKTGAGVKKFRATLNQSEWPGILTNDGSFTDESNNAIDKNKDLFLRLAASYAIEPKILTQYKRRAFFSVVNEYARVTLDIDLKYQLESKFNLIPGKQMTHYDNEAIYTKGESNGSCVILELKCPIGQVPVWMIDLIQHFELKQEGFSKYMNSSLTSMFDDGFQYMNPDRATPQNLFYS